MSIDSILIHTCTVQKEPKALVNKQPVNTAPVNVATLVNCRVEPIPSKVRDTILGRIPGAKFMATFGNVTLENNYLVTAISGYSGIGASELFLVQDLVEDTGRASLRYKTCILVEQKS